MKDAPYIQSTSSISKVNKIQNNSTDRFFGWLQNYDFSEGFFNASGLFFH